MSPTDFQVIVDKIKPFTNYIYLHVLGEPLLHPQFEKIVSIAQRAGLNINITTNGGLIEKRKDFLLSTNIRQINISMHDAEENIEPAKWADYFRMVLDFSADASAQTYICLRLWNTSNEASADFNAQCLNQIASTFSISFEDLNAKTKGNGLKLADHIFLQRSPRFEWPNEKNEGLQLKKNCYALRDHIAILAEGTVVPCCLDADATMNLGNIFTQDLHEILETERALNIKNGFEQHKVVEPICATCGFMID